MLEIVIWLKEFVITNVNVWDAKLAVQSHCAWLVFSDDGNCSTNVLMAEVNNGWNWDTANVYVEIAELT